MTRKEKKQKVKDQITKKKYAHNQTDPDYRIIARKIQEYSHEVLCSNGEPATTCANYPCDQLNYPIDFVKRDDKGK